MNFEKIVNSRLRKCKDSQGGVSKFYILPYTKWLRSQVRVVNMELVLVPSSDYYEFESWGDFGINQTMQEDDGGKFYNLNFSIKLDSGFNAIDFVNKEFRVVAKDRIGNTRMYGLWNGIQCESIGFTTGATKTDFTGYTLNFNGKEIDEAPYLNLTQIETSFLLQENGSYILQENLGKFII